MENPWFCGQKHGRQFLQNCSSISLSSIATRSYTINIVGRGRGCGSNARNGLSKPHRQLRTFDSSFCEEVIETRRVSIFNTEIIFMIPLTLDSYFGLRKKRARESCSLVRQSWSVESRSQDQRMMRLLSQFQFCITVMRIVSFCSTTSKKLTSLMLQQSTTRTNSSLNPYR